MFPAGQCWEHGKGGLAAHLFPTPVPISSVETLALHPASEAGIFIYEHDKASYKLTRQVDTELQIKIKMIEIESRVKDHATH